MEYERFLDKQHQPTEDEILSEIGQTSAWLDLKQYIDDNYDFIPEFVFYGAKYGWTLRYRKSGKTLCSLFPEEGAFSVLIVLGAKELEKALSMSGELSTDVQAVLEGTEHLHDGSWLWIRVLTESDVDSIKVILQAKRNPKKRVAQKHNVII